MSGPVLRVTRTLQVRVIGPKSVVVMQDRTDRVPGEPFADVIGLEDPADVRALAEALMAAADEMGPPAVAGAPMLLPLAAGGRRG